jgi:integrase/recombinase XerD
MEKLKLKAKTSLSMKEALLNYVMEIASGKAPLTVEAYKHDVSRLVDWLDERRIKNVKAFKSEAIRGYLLNAKEEGKSDSTLNRYYMSIKSFCRFLRKIKAISVDLTEDITPPRNIQKAPNVPTAEEVERLIDQPNCLTPSGVRDKAILELLYSSGLRASELCDLELKDVHKEQVIVRCGKRSKTRAIPITEKAYRAIMHYIDFHRGKQAGILFLTLMGKRINRNLLCAMVAHYARKAEIEGVTTHSLRHACASHLLDNGADLRMIQGLLGHSSIASTERYTHLSSATIQATFHARHPRANHV